MKYNLCKLFSLQRSGNHAVINWILGLDQENTLFFHQLRPGVDLLEKPSGVSLPEGTRAYVERVNGKKVYHPEYLDWFSEQGGRLLLSYESYRVGAFDEKLLNAPVLDRFGAPADHQNILVIRNPFNMLPSFEKLRIRTAQVQGRDHKWIMNQLNWQMEVWKSYAFLHLHSSVTRGNFVSVIFDHWVSRKDYRDNIAQQLGYENHDLFVDFVSDAGGGSSFSGHELNTGRDVLNRWDSASPELKELIGKHPEVIDYVALIFGQDAVPKEYFCR